MVKRKWYVLLAVMIVLVLVASACAGAATTETDTPPVQTEETAATDAPPATDAPAPTDVPEPTEEPAGPNVLKVANTANITTWDPIGSFSTEAAYMANIYEQLLRINPPGSAESFTPLLAESWETNEDGTVWTFNLRPGVTFHDGEPMNCRSCKDVTRSCRRSRRRFLHLVDAGQRGSGG